MNNYPDERNASVIAFVIFVDGFVGATILKFWLVFHSIDIMFLQYNQVI